jgi:3-oxoacyl-[acyl-carrier-protein] synthase-3
VLRSVLKGVGSALPIWCRSNQDLEAIIETSDQWIRDRTGITQRFQVRSETTASLAVEAAQKALEQAKVSPQEIDGIILATTTPDHPFPATACAVQYQIQASNAFAFDIQSVCCGFIAALSAADAFIQSQKARCLLVIGSERMTSLLDWSDRTTCVLFGDGAGAILLQAQQTTDDLDSDVGILQTVLRSDGQHYFDLYVDVQDANPGHPGSIRMKGREIYRQAIPKMVQAIQEVCKAQNIPISEIDWFIPHQANSRILKGVVQSLQVSEDRMIQTVGVHSNTSSASIPLALDWAWKHQKLQSGQLIALVGLGAGLSWGASLIRI